MDYQALGVGLGAVITALGAVITGAYTGRNQSVKDENDARIQIENAQIARDLAVENATRARIEALVQDAAEARKRLREMEEEYDEKYGQFRAELRAATEDSDRRYTELRKHCQRGWDLASHHFGLVAVLAHLLNNVFTVTTISEDREALWTVVTNCRKRMDVLKIPISLEQPLEDRENTAGT